MAKIFMFDVESDNLHGMGFQYGAVAFDSDTGKVALYGQKTTAYTVTSEWVQDNVKNLFGADLESDKELPAFRADFWDVLQKYKNAGYQIYTDCMYPVESNFLSACVADDVLNRAALTPFPLYDLGTLDDGNNSRFGTAASGIEIEKQHDPIWDSIASMIVLLKKMGIKTSVTGTLMPASDYFKTVATNMANDKLARRTV